jgi:hypothetical protein
VIVNVAPTMHVLGSAVPLTRMAAGSTGVNTLLKHASIAPAVNPPDAAVNIIVLPSSQVPGIVDRAIM